MQSRFVVAAVFALALAAQPLSFGQQSAAPPMHPHHPLPKPVNLKVLPKNIPPKELIQIMRGFSGALGVKCSFCHAGNPATHHLDFASDAKPQKTTARLMMRMTHTIDTRYLAKVNDPDATPLDKHVTCGTCHRGHSMPTQFVPPPEHHEHPPVTPGGPPQQG